MERRRAVRRGDIWDVELDPVVGHEQGGRRPALVVSSDVMNTAPSRLVMVLPITGRDRGLASQYRVEPPKGELTKPSFILGDQLRTVSTAWLDRRRGLAASETLAGALRIVRFLLDLPRATERLRRGSG